VRYEDLVTNPEKALEGMLQFMFDLEDIEGTNLQKRLKEVIAMGAAAT